MLISPAVAFDEINLIDYPLSIFGKYLERPIDKAPRITNISIYNKNLKKPINGYVKVNFLNDSHTQYLLPQDEDVILALSELTVKSPLDSPEIEFPSLSYIFNALGWKRYGDNYTRILESFKRLRGITIETDVYYDKKSKTYGYQLFGILSAVYVAKIAIDEVDVGSIKRANNVRVIWDPIIWKSFKDGNYKYINMNIYRALDTPGARKLYRILDKRFYMKTAVKLPIDYLGEKILSLDNKRGTYYYKRFISKYADELVRVNYISQYLYENEYVLFRY